MCLIQCFFSRRVTIYQLRVSKNKIVILYLWVNCFFSLFSGSPVTYRVRAPLKYIEINLVFFRQHHFYRIEVLFSCLKFVIDCSDVALLLLCCCVREGKKGFVKVLIGTRLTIDVYEQTNGHNQYLINNGYRSQYLGFANVLLMLLLMLLLLLLLLLLLKLLLFTWVIYNILKLKEKK
jgi:hypothetical protein